MQIIQFTKKDAKTVTGGGLTQNSKMPCPTYNLPPAACNTGRKLAKTEGNICADCYACKGFATMYPSVATSQNAHLRAINLPQWADAMITLIKPLPYFRFHSAGDIQSMRHWLDIIRIIQACPDTQFWIPTRERGIIKQYIKDGGLFPDNLMLRLSATKFDKPSATFSGLPTSTSHKNGAPIGFACNAQDNNGECGPCRACWDKSIENISYPSN